MSAVDWVLLAIVAASAVFGLMRGFVGVLASLAAWVLAGWAAFRYGGDVGLLLAADGEPSASQLLGGYALSFIVVLLAVGVVGWLVRKLVQSIGLSGLDRLLGLLLGVARGAFVACALVLLLGLTAVPRTPEWHASPLVPVFVPGAQWMRGWLPDWAAERVDFHGDAQAPALVSPAGVAALPLPVELAPSLEVAAGDVLLERMQSMQRGGSLDSVPPEPVSSTSQHPQDLPPSQQHPSTPGS
jgi:membrane protein required for colicin V production